jgi:hypothetical protein
MRDNCSAEQQAACPIMQGCVGNDTHHLAYPANQYRTKVEKRWRELDFNKEELPRCLHNAIHSTGYVPEKPDRTTMLSEVWGNNTDRQTAELHKQLFLGELALSRDGEVK